MASKTNTTQPIPITPESLARILNSDKMLLSRMGDICFHRCIVSYDKEYLNQIE